MARAGGRLACGKCRDPRWTGYIDESVRRRYTLAALLVCRCQRDSVSRAARSLILPGQQRLHLSHESDGRRKKIVGAVNEAPVYAVVVHSAGTGPPARSACWSQMVARLTTLMVGNIVIEALDGGEARDRRDIAQELTGYRAEERFTYEHRSHRGEPLLWFSDAVAWAAGAPASWQTRLKKVLIDSAGRGANPVPHRPETNRAHFRS